MSDCLCAQAGERDRDNKNNRTIKVQQNNKNNVQKFNNKLYGGNAKRSPIYIVALFSQLGLTERYNSRLLALTASITCIERDR